VEEDLQLRAERGNSIADRVKPLGLGWPNIVSALRVLLVPLLVWLIVLETPTASYVAAAVFVVGAFSDGLDGYLARRHSMTTATGIWLDPLSDKIFVGAPIVAMTLIGGFPLWAAIVIIAREAAVSVFRAWLGSRKTSMPASNIAKMKTATQLFAIALYLLPVDGVAAVRLAVLIVAVALTVYSGLDYFVRMRPSRLEQPEKS
jgi:CDP-diacylglycerol---glycerol-3-phosphate 3-phosphatidyltransferase